MSSNTTPASFASAAAGQSRGSRMGDSGGDWSRREGRSTNGTMTFRRTSAGPTSHHSQVSVEASESMPSVAESSPAGHSLPSHDGSQRYSRANLLSIFKANTIESIDVSNLFTNGWNPEQVNGSGRGWGKSSENAIPQDPTVCWDASGRVKLMALQEMTQEDKATFSDVNSTLKPQQQKETNQVGSINGRKTSISHGSGYNVLSPLSASRPTGPRRRETSDANPTSTGLASPPATSRAPRDDVSWFGRKVQDSKDPQQSDEPSEEPSAPASKQNHTASLARSTAAGGTSGVAGSMVWGTSSSASSSVAAGGTGSTVGAFGNFSLPTTIGEKRFTSTRGENRLAHLLNKQDPSETSSGTKPRNGSGEDITAKDSRRIRSRTDTDPFSDDGDLVGSGSGLGSSSVHQSTAYLGRHPIDHSAKVPPGSELGLSGLTIGTATDDDIVGSPETNPYGSPVGDHGDDLILQATAPSTSRDHGLAALGGPSGDHTANFGSIRGYPSNAFDDSDRSQTSSVGPKGFPALGSIAGWGNVISTSTPDRERAVFSSAFGTSLFSPATGDLPSPGFDGAVSSAFGVPSTGAAGPSGSLRGVSKLGSLFPTGLHTQMVGGQDQEGNLNDSIPDLRQSNPLGAIGRESLVAQGREAEGMGRPGRGIFDELMEANAASTGSFAAGEQQFQTGLSLASGSSPLSQPQLPFDTAPRSSTDTPPNLPRTMVMPDRMRWVYLDPQGQTQGPFTGLEMNDWYKANFFTPDLRVKKVEDVDFEPLGQLIRRIGNSREPFLVPQIGIAHGQPTLTGTFTHGDRGTVIPPLVGAFPSYGRTLTAEEQNNLERRKQEEQYMLARQREMMAVAQHHPFPGGRLPTTGIPSGALHHHSSAHSLQSQPSFGSMTSPLTTAPPPISSASGATPAFFDMAGMPPATQPPVAISSEFIRDQYSQERQAISGFQTTAGTVPAVHPLQALGIPADQPAHSALPSVNELQKDSQGFSERLKEFKHLRENLHIRESGYDNISGISLREGPGVLSSENTPLQQSTAFAEDEGVDSPQSSANGLSLTQQVQQTQAAAAAAKHHTVEADTFVEPQTDLPLPFPPPQGLSATPLAAPRAQRSRSTLPDQYATSRSRSETPESGTVSSMTQPPIAPWARDLGTDNQKGPSLRDIQEAEARKAARVEEVAAAARKAAAEQETALLREQEKATAAVAPGLPTSSTWATGSPSASAPNSPWSKPGATKVGIPPSASSVNVHRSTEKKKTLAEIQREEEVRKLKNKEHGHQSSSTASKGLGKRYADFASKPQTTAAANQSTPAATSGSGGWATVGAGGKVKSPTTSLAGRSVSAAIPASKPTVAPQPTVRGGSKHLTGKVEHGGMAMEEFNKWLHRELGRGISGGIDINGFADTLLQLPLDQTIISEAVYANSTTMDGRHFAEEFIRRMKLVDRGVVEKQTSTPVVGDSAGGGGWNEVVKKSSMNHQKEEGIPAGFKVVPSRKKGKK